MYGIINSAMLEKAQTHFVFLTLGVILCAFSLFSIVRFTDPFTAGSLTHILLYLSVFLLCLGLFTLIGILIRQRFFYGIYIANLITSFRQAILLATLVTGSLLLQAQGLRFWWVELLFILFLMVLEIFFNL
jgi:hypothetical protein